MTGAQVGQFLADFGAEVVAVEPPTGSPLRHQAAFPLWGRGKHSVVLDVHQDADLSALVDLVVGADVLVEALGPGAAERLGIDYEAVAARNPGLIHASITGFGTEGPLAGIKGYEALVMAKIGGLSGFRGMLSRPGPAFAATPYASWSATQATLHGILAALYEREGSGRGQRTETSLAHAVGALDPWGWMVQWLTQQYPDAFQAAPPIGKDGVPNSSFVYRLLVALTADGRWLQFSQVQPRLFKALMRSVGLDWMFDDPKWQGLPELVDPGLRAELWERLLEAVKEKTLDDWQRIFAADHDVWAEVFRHGSELLHHPQMVHNGMVTEIDDSELGTVRQPGALVRMSETPARLERSAPLLDEHSQLRTEGWPARYAPGPSGHTPFPGHESVPTGRGPLEGVTVLELGTFYAAPFGTTLLTDFGARVIKIEPLEGDPMRTILPFPESGAARVMQGKESVALDMASEKGREIIHEIAKGSDLVLQCFRAGVAERLGVDAAALRSTNPDLVYLSAPGYGIDGPNGHCPAFAPTIGAGAGFAWRNIGSAVPERADLSVSEIRVNSLRLTASAGPGFAQADGVSAVVVTTALLLGLLARRRGGGAGQEMLTTMLSSAAHALSEDMVEYEGRARLPLPDDQFFGIGALYRLYETADGWIFLAAPNQSDWAPLVQSVARFADLSGPQFATIASRQQRDEELAQRLSEVFRQRPGSDWEGDLTDADVGCAVVAPAPVEANFLGEMGRANGYVSEVDHPTFGHHPRLSPLVRFSRSEARALPGCLLGQHTQSVLREIGLADDRITALQDKGVVAL
jgi:crotonobetainyl-CoA:carnitine CoA-transferase CaiB-like acyl-CoA transferase